MNKQQRKTELLQELTKLATQLQRVPRREEFVDVVCSKHVINDLFGGYQIFLNAAGLSSKKPMQRKLDDMFIKPVPEKLINKHQLSYRGTTKILIAGDMHLPWIHEPTLEAFLYFNKVMQPEIVIQIGDLYDMYAHTRFPKSQNIYTPKDEQRIARERGESFWAQVRKDNPNARCIQFKGNHDIRPLKRVLEALPEMEDMVEEKINKLMTFDGVELISDHREIKRIAGIAFHHGYLAKLGDHRDKILENVVVGHTHIGGVSYRGMQNKTIWELNVGLMGDPVAKVMSYTSTKENQWTLGFGYIDEMGPRFIAT